MAFVKKISEVFENIHGVFAMDVVSLGATADEDFQREAIILHGPALSEPQPIDLIIRKVAEDGTIEHIHLARLTISNGALIEKGVNIDIVLPEGSNMDLIKWTDTTPSRIVRYQQDPFTVVINLNK